MRVRPEEEPRARAGGEHDAVRGRRRRRSPFWVALTVICVLALTLRLVRPTADPPVGLSWSDGIFTDGPTTVSAARIKMLNGYWGIGLNWFPVLSAATFTSYKLLGLGLAQARLPFMLAGSACALLLGLLLRREAGARAALIGALMEKLVSFGARPAGPGEFTRRAFLNGRIDLAQAEAVGAIVHAHAESEYRAAQAALAGHFSHGIGSLRAQLAKLAARVTVALDFSDQDVEIISPADTLACLQPMRSELADLLARRGEGRINSHAVRVVLFGPPNAGKSSLFNAILKRRQAIVSPHPGTTRDTLEAEIRAGGAQIILTDTAGLHRPADDLEAAAVSRAEDALQAADLALCMLDATARPSGNTENALQLARGQRTLVILNKCDLGPCRAEVKAILPTDVESLAVSAMTGQGVDAALSWIARCLRKDDVDRGPGRLMVNARQARLLRRALEAMDRALSAESCGTAMDLVAEDLTDALRALSEITGDVVTDDVLDRIFADFCIGK